MELRTIRVTTTVRARAVEIRLKAAESSGEAGSRLRADHQRGRDGRIRVLPAPGLAKDGVTAMCSAAVTLGVARPEAAPSADAEAHAVTVTTRVMDHRGAMEHRDETVVRHETEPRSAMVVRAGMAHNVEMAADRTPVTAVALAADRTPVTAVALAERTVTGNSAGTGASVATSHLDVTVPHDVTVALVETARSAAMVRSAEPVDREALHHDVTARLDATVDRVAMADHGAMVLVETVDRDAMPRHAAMARSAAIGASRPTGRQVVAAGAAPIGGRVLPVTIAARPRDSTAGVVGADQTATGVMTVSIGTTSVTATH